MTGAVSYLANVAHPRHSPRRFSARWTTRLASEPAPEPARPDSLDERLHAITAQIALLTEQFAAFRLVVQEAVLIAGNSPSSSLMKARDVLDYIGRDVYDRHLSRLKGYGGAKSRPLAGLLDQIKGRGVMPSRVVAAATYVNNLGSAATHNLSRSRETGKALEDFTREDVLDSLEKLLTVLDWYCQERKTVTEREPEVEPGERLEPLDKDGPEPAAGTEEPRSVPKPVGQSPRPKPRQGPQLEPAPRAWWNSPAMWVSAALVVAALGGLAIALVWRYARTPAADPVQEALANVDPCDPTSMPPLIVPAGPEAPPPVDAVRALLPPEGKPELCTLTVLNETGKRLRIWRHVYRPKDHPRYAEWRPTPICKPANPPFDALAGWAYIVIEEIDDNVGKATSVEYLVAGWKFFDYGSRAMVCIKAHFLEAPRAAIEELHHLLDPMTRSEGLRLARLHSGDDSS